VREKEQWVREKVGRAAARLRWKCVYLNDVHPHRGAAMCLDQAGSCSANQKNSLAESYDLFPLPCFVRIDCLMRDLLHTLFPLSAPIHSSSCTAHFLPFQSLHLRPDCCCLGSHHSASMPIRSGPLMVVHGVALSVLLRDAHITYCCRHGSGRTRIGSCSRA
jgi:hypothetical protein